MSNTINKDTNINNIVDYIAKSVEEYEIIAQKRDLDGPVLDRALDIVKKFIIERKIIVFGGLGLDYALRLRGSAIYTDARRPDFDTLSSNSVSDSYDLAERLRETGFKDVGAVRAIHVQTMKVKTDCMFIIDIGYVPPNIFETLPTLNYQGIRILHPDYQRMDMHLAFCYPMSGAPREDVFHRWKKDTKRFNIVNSIYPITVGKLGGESVASEYKYLKIRTAVNTEIFNSDAALHGFAAYGLMRSALDELAAACEIEAKVSAPLLPVLIEDKWIEFTVPNEIQNSLILGEAQNAIFHKLAIASPEPEKVIKAFGLPVDKYNPYVDIRPEMFVSDSAIIYSTEGRKFAMCVVSCPKMSMIVSSQAILLYFLLEAHLATDNTIKNMFTQFYLWTLEIINRAMDIFQNNVKPTTDDATFTKLLNSSPFIPSTRTMGKYNFNEAYLIRIAQSQQAVGATVGATSIPGISDSKKLQEKLVGLPSNYYPPRKRPIDFDYNINALFQRNGKKVEK